MSKLRQRRLIRQRITSRQIKIVSSILVALTLTLAVLFNVGPQKEVKAGPGSETLSAGSFIVNMGITPQTINNGLKPYGLIYDLIVNFNVPVKWIIEPSKAKDGTDFTYSSTNYKGGPFIIQAEYINATVSARIAYWLTQGVQGAYTTSSLTVPVYSTLTSFPLVLIDSLSSNQQIVINYFNYAGIPSSVYSTGAPVNLNTCHDLWVNPHGDPSWATHSYLYNFVTVQKSYIWSQCHAVSMMEDSRNPLATRQLNFLTTNGLKCWKNNGCTAFILEYHAKLATAPYTYYYPADPVAQFMGSMDGATTAGSEQWFIPLTSGGWRATTQRIVTTATGTSPREGAVMVYGPAYGTATNGWVMYEGGHALDSSGTVSDHVSAIRGFFNFILLAGKAKAILFSASSIPSTFNSGQILNVSVTVTSGMPPYTYQWTSSIGGTFADPNAAATTFQASSFISDTQGILQCIVTDACGRRNFISQFITVNASPLPVSLLNFKAEPLNDNTVLINWSTASEINNDYFTVERSKDAKQFEELAHVKGSGSTSTSKAYSYTDEHPYNGTFYYRLKQTDFNGKYETFKIVTVTLKEKPAGATIARISPNPFNESFTAQFESPEKEEVTLQLINTSGKIIFTEKIMAEMGMNLYRCYPVKQLNTGTYIFRISNNKEVLGNAKVICKKS